MSYSTILVTLDGGSGSKQALAAAVQLAKRFGATLDLLALPAPVTPLLAAGGLASEAYATEVEASREASREALQQAVATVEAANAPYEATMVASPLASIREAVAARGLLADLIVTPQSGLNGDLTHGAIDGALFGAPAPLLIWPEDCDPASAATLGARPTLAWDARPQAALAAHFAVPLLSDASTLIVTMVAHAFGDEPYGEDPGAPVLTWLKRRGLTGELRQLKGSPVGELLLNDAAERSSDVIIMGGYSHSQLREAIFGGVTETLLNRTKIPLFMAH